MANVGVTLAAILVETRLDAEAGRQTCTDRGIVWHGLLVNGRLAAPVVTVAVFWALVPNLNASSRRSVRAQTPAPCGGQPIASAAHGPRRGRSLLPRTPENQPMPLAGAGTGGMLKSAPAALVNFFSKC